MDLRNASEEEFAALVEAATRYRGSKIVDVAVKGFSFTLTLTSKRYRYDVTAWFDAAANKWTTVDPYSGGSLHSVIRKIEEAARATP